MTQSFFAGPRAGRSAVAAGALLFLVAAHAANEAPAAGGVSAAPVQAAPATAASQTTGNPAPAATAAAATDVPAATAPAPRAAAAVVPDSATAPTTGAATTFAGPRATPPAAVQNASAAGAAVASASSLTQVAFVLLLVVGLIAGAAWLLRRLGMARNSVGSTVRIVSGVSLSNRERILVVEVADQWIVVGVSPGGINTLTTMPRQEPVAGADGNLPAPPGKQFASWLKQTIERRNAAAAAARSQNDH